MSGARRAGLVQLIGILVSGATAMGGYRLGYDAVMACGIIGMIGLAIWTFTNPGSGSGDAGYSGADCDGGGGDGE